MRIGWNGRREGNVCVGLYELQEVMNLSELKPPLRLSFHVYDKTLEAQYTRYSKDSGKTKISIFNKLLEFFFGIPQQFDDDYLENLDEVKRLLATIEWEKVNAIYENLQKDPIHAGVPKVNFLLSLIVKGTKHYEDTVDNQNC